MAAPPAYPKPQMVQVSDTERGPPQLQQRPHGEEGKGREKGRSNSASVGRSASKVATVVLGWARIMLLGEARASLACDSVGKIVRVRCRMHYS